MTVKRIFSFVLGATLLASGWAGSLWAKPPYKVYSYMQGGAVDPRTSAAINLNSLPWNSITHVMDSFGLPTGAPNTIDMSGARGVPLISAAHANATRANLSLGGAFPTANTTNFNNGAMAANRSVFVAAITNTVATYGYDGVDIDWEFPSAAEKANFMGFMQSLYSAIKAMPSAYDGQPRDLTFFISAGVSICGVDWATIGNYCDAGIMSGYDYYVDAYNGPLVDPVTYGDCAGTSATGDIVGTYNKITGAGIPPAKLALGCPLYGTPLEVPIIKLLQLGTGAVYHAAAAEFSATYLGTVTYGDNAQSYCDKINWALGKGMQGIGLWEMDYAYPPTDPLVTSLWATIGGTAACLNLGTPTFTVTSTYTRTRTATRTVTTTPTVSATLTVTVSATPSFSATRTITPTDTLTVTPTRTATLSNTSTITLSSTASVTPSLTHTSTVTITPSSSATPTVSATPSATLTSTNVPVGSTFTYTSTITATFSASPSVTPSWTATGTETKVDTATQTQTSSPSMSATQTQTPSPSMTATQTQTSTVTAIDTNTASPSPSGTVTVTSTPTVSPVGSATFSPSATPSSTATQTGSTAASTATPGSGGPLEIEKVLAAPNPASGGSLHLQLLLRSAADSVDCRIYTTAYTLITHQEVTGLAAGWSTAVINLPTGLATGRLYAVVRAKRANAVSRPAIAKIFYFSH